MSRDSSPPPTTVNHNLEILTTFKVDAEEDMGDPGPRTENSMRYHGRPLELTVAMLNMAYSRSIPHRQDAETEIHWDQDLMNRLAPGRLQLLSVVPYILPLATLYFRHIRERSIPNTLLLYITAYLSALTMTPEQPYAGLLDNLAGGIEKYCGLLYLAQTAAVAGVQALDLLANFAPLGVLPCRSASPHKVVVARGHIVNARCIARSIRLDINTRTDIWTWLSVCATSATYKMEDDGCYDCPEIFEARTLSDAMVGLMSVSDEPEYLAQLTLCERIARLSIVFQALASFKSALQTSIDNMFYDAQEAIKNSLLTAKQSFEATKQRFKYLHDFADHSKASPVCATSLNIRRLYEDGKVQRSATISFIAAALVRESPADLGDEYHFMTCTAEELKQKRYETAMSAASDPQNIAQWFKRNQDPLACDTVNTWARDRLEGIEEMFVAFGGLDTSSEAGSDPKVRPLAPWQYIASILVEGSNVLLDLQAAHLVNTGSAHSQRQAHRMSRRAYMMRQVSRTMRTMEGRRSNTTSSMCSNLIGSMARIYESRTARLQVGSEVGSSRTQQEPPTPESDYDVFRRLCAFLNEPDDPVAARPVSLWSADGPRGV